MYKYKLAENIIDKEDIAALIAWLGGKNNSLPQLTKGVLTTEFEAQWAKWVGTNYAVFVNSGSSANLLMAYAALLSKKLRNKKVIVPSTGWVTTISPFMQLGFEPIMCGANPDTFGFDPDQLEALLKQHDPALVIMVQVLGVPDDMDVLKRLQKKYKFMLLEDACAALGAEYDGKRVGTFGDMSSFSFFFGHQLSTIEGGMINTNDKKLYDLLLLLRSHGWGKDLDEKTNAGLMKKYKIDSSHNAFTFFVPGLNLRNTDLGAFLGLRMMKKADSVSKIRMRNHLIYAENLKNITFQKWNSKAVPCSISFAALARDEAHRKKIVTELNRNFIETRLFTAANLGLHPFWFETYGKFHHPVSDAVYSRGFFLPNHESLSAQDVKSICKVVNKINL